MLEHLVNLFFPKVCAACKGILNTNENTICTGCRHELPVTNHFTDFENDAYKMFYGRIDVHFVASLLYFQKHSLVQEIIYSLKYRGNQQVGRTLGLWAASYLHDISTIQKFDFLVSVPLHPRKMRSRGYNQVFQFGEAISETLDIPFEPKLLKRNVYTKSQTKKNLIKRNELKTNVFEAVFENHHHEKHFVILDDVLTTGSTIEACAKALQKIPGAKISVVCMAFTH